MSRDEDLGPEFEDEGIWYKFRCPECEAIVEFEDDVRGEQIECDVCGCKGQAKS